MPFPVFYKLPRAEDDVMVNPYIVADGACFTGDNAGAMIDKEMRPHARAGLA
jgi:hypothetical protein